MINISSDYTFLCFCLSEEVYERSKGVWQELFQNSQRIFARKGDGEYLKIVYESVNSTGYETKAGFIFRM